LSNLLSLSASGVGLELRPLCSIGISRLQRSYAPLCHAASPIFHTCDHHYPGRTTDCVSLAFACDCGLTRHSGGATCASTFSRPARCSFTLRPACSPGSLKNPPYRRLQPLRWLHHCPSCYRPQRKLPGGIRTRWKTARWHDPREDGLNGPATAGNIPRTRLLKVSFSSQRSSGREDAALHTVSTRRGLCAELLVIGEAVSRAKAAPSLNHRNASGGGATREPSLLACARRSVCGVPADRSGSLSDLEIQRIPYASDGLNGGDVSSRAYRRYLSRTPRSRFLRPRPARS